MRVIPSLLWNPAVAGAATSHTRTRASRTPRRSAAKIGNRVLSRNEKFRGGKSPPRDAASDLVIRDARRLAPVVRLVDLEVGEESGRLVLQDAEHRDGEPTDLQLGALARAELEHRAPGARVPRDDDLRLRGVGQHAARGLAGHLPAVDLVRDPAVALHQLRDERHVRALCGVDLGAPRALERVVSRDRRWHDEARLALV